MEQPSYYAVIPADVRYNKGLKPMEKLIYGELTCLCQKQGYCWASNSYFSQLYEVSKETVSRWFSHLQDCGYIKISLDPAYENGRRITLFDVTKVNGVGEKVNTPHDEQGMPPLDENVNHNNTRVNTTSVNIPPNTPKGDGSIFFERLWELYPNKKGKGRVSTKKKGELLAVGYEQLARCIDRYRAMLAQEVWRKPQDGGTFFNRGYLDYLDGKQWENETEGTGVAAGQYGKYL